MVNPLSKCSIHTESYIGDQPIAIGTSFLYRLDGDLWLITAGHTLTAHHADTGEALVGNGVHPDRLVIRLGSDTQVADKPVIRWTGVQLTLYDDDLEPVWHQHPDGPVVDVGAIRIPSEHAERFAFHHAANDELDCLTRFSVQAGQDAFVLGYPLGVAGGGRLPIWKRATVASERNALDRWFLVDTASREGMSGAPVFARQVGLVIEEGTTFGNDSAFGEAFRFIGVYTSRPLHDGDGVLAQLGRVFDEAAIIGTIRGAAPGTD